MKAGKLNRKGISEGLENALPVEVFEKLDSTSTEARRRVGAGRARAELILSEEQTAGRGRVGHSFYSPKYEGIYMTLVFDASPFKEALLRVTAKAAVAVVRGIRAVTGLSPKIKWVNDVYLGHEKVAGILAECVRAPEEAGGKPWLLLGIGINVTTARFPEELRGQAGALVKEAGALPDRNALVIAVIRALLDELKAPEETAYLNDYRAWSNVLGRRIVYGSYNSEGQCVEQHGTAAAIDDTGALVVLKANGRREVLGSGEIRVRVPETEREETP